MTQLGEFLLRQPVRKADIARKTGISKSRLSELSNNEHTHLKAKELYLIALAVNVDPGIILTKLYS